MFRSRSSAGALGALFLGIAVGCARVEPPESGEAEQNLAKIGRAYMKATGGLKRPPHNASELTTYLRQMGEPDSVLRSPRDGQEYVILWDLQPADLAPKTSEPPERRYSGPRL
jgi:hypothetical protein